jgi:hypothetical protein
MKTRPRDGTRSRPRRPPPVDIPPFLYVFAAVARPPSRRWLAALPSMPGGRPPRALPVARDIALVVADVPPSLYASDVLEPRLGDADWVSAAAAAHHRVIERLLARSRGLLPFRMFTIFSSEARLAATLAPTAAKLRRALKSLDGRQEWVLRIGPPDPARASGEARVSLATRKRLTSGTAFLLQRAQAAVSRRLRSDRIRADTAAVVAALEKTADRSSARSAPAGSSLLVDAAFLVQRRRLAAFRRALARRAVPLLAEGCAVSLTGPWPPYSFASID